MSIGDNKTATVNIIAAIAGKSGNVPANTITVNSDKLSVYPVLQMKQLQQAAMMRKVMKILLSVSRNMTSHRIILLSEMITITDVGR